MTATRPPLLPPVLAADLGRSREIITSSSRSRVDSIQWPCLLGGTRLFREYFVLCVMYTVKQPVFYSTLLVQAIAHSAILASTCRAVCHARGCGDSTACTVQYCAVLCSTVHPAAGSHCSRVHPESSSCPTITCRRVAPHNPKGLVHTREDLRTLMH